MSKSVLVSMPAKLEAEKIASWLTRVVAGVSVAPYQGSWAIVVPTSRLHRAQTALKKVIAAANPGRIVARKVVRVGGARLNGSKSIPKGQIEWIVDRMHVGTSDAQIETEIRKRTTGAGWTPAKVREAIAYALKHHAHNRGVFHHVMRGIPNPRQPECCAKLGTGAPCARCGKHTHFTVDWIIPARVVDDRPACSSSCAVALKRSPARNVQPPYRGPKQRPRPPLTDKQRQDIKEMSQEERWRERERREDEAMDRAREGRNPASSSDKRYNVWAYNRATGGSFELERNVTAKTAVRAYRAAVKQGLRPWCIDLTTRNEVHPTRSGNLPNPVNKRARREARRAEIRLKEQLGLRGRPLAQRGPWTGGQDAFNQGRRAGSGYVRFWLWNDREWKLSLRSSYDGVEGEPSLRESAKWAADEEAKKESVVAKFPGQIGKWKAGFVLAFEKALADTFGPRREWSDADEDWKDPSDVRQRAYRKLTEKRKRAAVVAAARAKRGLSPNPSREVRLAREAKVKMLLVRITSILQAGHHKMDKLDVKGAVESYQRAEALWDKMPKGVAMVSPRTRREAYELSRVMVRLQNRIVMYEPPRPPRAKKNAGERYLIQGLRPKHRNWVTIDYAQDETRALLNALHRARLGKDVTYRVWDTDKVEEVWRGTGAEATIERWKKIRPAGLVGANRRTSMHRNPRLSSKMHPLRENTMRLGDAMKYGRILLDAGIPIHLWDGSGWEVAIKPDDSYSTSSGRAKSGGRRYLSQGAGLIKTWPITLLSEAIQPGAFIGVPAIKHFLAHRRSGVASNGRACPNPLCKATAMQNPGARANVLIRGDKLNQRQFEQVLSAYIYRWTTGNAARTRVYKCPVCKVPGGDPNGGVACRKYHPTIPLISDNQWVKEHAFHFTKDGSRLMANRHHAEPAYMAKENPRRLPTRRVASKGTALRIGDHVSLVNTSFAGAGPFKSKYATGEHVMTPPVHELNKHKSIWTVRTGAEGVITAIHRWPTGVNYIVKFERGYSILGSKHLARIYPKKLGVRRNSDTVNDNARIQHEQIVEAFLSGRKKKVGPRYWTDGTLLRVWGNLVAKRDPTGVELYDAGYRTLLTKNILNTVLRHLGQGTIYQKGFTWYISTPQGNKTWPGNWTVLTGGAAANRGRRVARNGRGENLTVSDIAQWIDNDEGLYNWWRGSRQSKTAFIRANRAELEAAIRGALNRPPAQKTWRDYAGMNPRIRAWDIIAYIPGKPERWTMQSGIKDKKRAEDTAQVYRDIAKKERRRHRYVVRPFRYSDTASRRKNPLTARESARLIRKARSFMGSAKDEFTSRGRHYRYGQASGVAAAVQLAGPRRAEVPAAMIRGRAMKAHRVAGNPRRRHAGLNGLMKNGDAKKAMRFA